MAPEYCLRGEISTKSDIYSLGILFLILEVVTGQKNHQVLPNKSGELFIENVRNHITSNSNIQCTLCLFLPLFTVCYSGYTFQFCIGTKKLV